MLHIKLAESLALYYFNIKALYIRSSDLSAYL